MRKYFLIPKAALVLLLLGLLMLGLAAVAAAQTPQGGTLTVKFGQIAVIRPNGTAAQPAPSGMVLGVGDQVATLGQSTALVTFFEGSELEIGWGTTIIIREIRTVGNEVHFTVEDVLGTATARVKAFVNPNSTYTLQSPGGRVVALIRGSAVRMTVFNNGKVNVDCIEPPRVNVDIENPCGIKENEGGALGDEDEEEDGDEDEEKDDDPYQEGYRGPAPLTVALVANRLTGGIDRLSATGSLLVLGALGWTFYGYRPGRRGDKDGGGDPSSS